MDRLLAVAHAYHRVLLSWESSGSTQRFWCNRLFEVGAEYGMNGAEILERFEAFIAVGYWE